MKKPTLATQYLLRTLCTFATVGFLAACSGDVTAPPAATAPAGVNKALIGTADGIYTFVVQPGEGTTLRFGQGQLSVPANAICSLATSGYGPSFWNAPCSPEQEPVVITATVSGAQTTNPRVDFSPALRFNPNANVRLTLIADKATVNALSIVKYCSDFGGCVDESIMDPSVATSAWKIDVGYMFSRRVKHFSGYMVSE